MAPGQFESCTAHHLKPLKPHGFKGFLFAQKHAALMRPRTPAEALLPLSGHA